MRLRSVLIVALAFVVGVSAARGLKAFLDRRGGPAPKVDTVPVVVALIDIARGGIITSDQIKMREFPEDLVPEGALSQPEDAIGRAVAIPLFKGETVLDAKLSPKGAGTCQGLVLIPRGMRAFTIHTPSVASGVAGFVIPGNKVDVLLTVHDSDQNDGTGGGRTTTLLQGVEILAVDPRIDAPADNKGDAQDLRSVTLLVTPIQANLLDVGQSKGTFHLALRGPKGDAD